MFLFSFSSHLLITSEKKNRTRSCTFTHGRQLGDDLLRQEEKISTRVLGNAKSVDVRVGVLRGRSTDPVLRVIAQIFQQTEPVLSPVTSVSVTAHSSEASATSKLTAVVADLQNR